MIGWPCLKKVSGEKQKSPRIFGVKNSTQQMSSAWISIGEMIIESGRSETVDAYGEPFAFESRIEKPAQKMNHFASPNKVENLTWV